MNMLEYVKMAEDNSRKGGGGGKAVPDPLRQRH